jgi:putative ABC transport system ATP-binding protein
MPTESVCVQVRDVHKSFKRGSEVVDVLNGLNLDVQQGEFVGLMGPSGSDRGAGSTEPGGSPGAG